MEKRLFEIPGVERSNPQVDGYRMEMTRCWLGTLQAETAIGVVDVQNRMADYGIDAPWPSHEPRVMPESITPEAGEVWSKEGIDCRIDVLAQVVQKAYEASELDRSAPHNQVVQKLADTPLDDPEIWAAPWRAYQRKRSATPV